MPETVVLDNSALSYLCDSRCSRADRKILHSLVKSGEVRIRPSYYLAFEAAGLLVAGKGNFFLEKLQELMVLTNGSIKKPAYNLKKRLDFEKENGRAFRETELLTDWTPEVKKWLSGKTSGARYLHLLVVREKAMIDDLERRSMLTDKASLNPAELQALLKQKDVFSRPLKAIREYVADICYGPGGLPRSLDAEKLPTWWAWSARCAQKESEEASRRLTEVGKPDGPDVVYFADAAYADVLVAVDRPFLRWAGELVSLGVVDRPRCVLSPADLLSFRWRNQPGRVVTPA